MTIRQQGGVFGRNPKFNSLDVDNDTQIDGDISSQIASGVDGVHIARSTGSATPTPVELRLQTKTNAGDWSTSDPWGRISLFSQDTSGGGGKIHASIEAIAAHSSGGRSKLALKTSSSSSDDLQDALVIDPDTGSGRHVTVSDGNLVIGTSGKGIDFSATSGTGTSELFDDYEEGTWTPVVADNSSGGNTGTSLTAQGEYTKIGNLVYAKCMLQNIDTTGLTSTAALFIQGLPFTSVNTVVTSRDLGSCGFSGDVTFSGFVAPSIPDNSASVVFFETVSGVSFDYLDVSEFNSGAADIYFSVTYRAA